MTLMELFVWHREQAERYEDLAKNHTTTGARVHRAAVTRRYVKQAEFHQAAAGVLKPLVIPA